MAKTKQKFIKKAESACNAVMRIGRWVGARRFLFVWSAISVAVALFVGAVESVYLYKTNYILNTDIFVLTRLMDAIFLFLKLFTPMFVLVLAVKYIFDCNGKHSGRASETFRLSFIAAMSIGLLIAVFYYLNAGLIIGSNPSRYCTAGTVCWFSWGMLGLAGRAFLTSGLGLLLTFLGLRGIYTELSYILSKK